MAEQKGGQVTHETNLTFDDNNTGNVKKLQKSGDGSWSDADGLFSLVDDSSIFEFDVHGNENFPIIFERLDLDDDDDDDASSEDLSASSSNFCSLPGIFSIFNDPGIHGEQTDRTDRLEYFATSPFDVLFEDETVPRVANNNDSGGGYGGVSTSNEIDQEMLTLMASTPDHFVPTDLTVAINASDGEATTGQSLEQERDRVSVGDSENSIDGEKRGEGEGGFLLGWWQKCSLLLGLWKLV